MQTALNRSRLRLTRAGTLLAGALLIAASAWLYAHFLPAKLGLYAAGALAAGLVTYRWPATCVTVAFAMSGSYGSLKAFFGFPANGTATGVLAGMAVACVGALVFARRRQRVMVWPATVVMALYVVFVVASYLFSPVSAPALKVARTEGLYILGMLLIAYGPWREGTHRRARQAIVWAALGVGAYATLRYGIGAAPQERAQVTATAFNQTSSGHNKVQGSFPSGVELGLWTGSVIPYLVGVLLTARGRIRMVAIVALPLCLVGLLGSGLRTGLVAAILGTVVVLIVYAFAVSMPGSRPLVLVVAVLGLVGCGAVLFPHVVGGNVNTAHRYQDLLNPTQDSSFQRRLTKWEQAFSAVGGHPFGFGLGTVGPEAQGQPTIRLVNQQLDSSYVRIAFEQGIAVMVLFVAGLVLLLTGLIRRGIATLDRNRAGPAIAAAGTLAAGMILMFTEMFLTAPCALAIWVIVGLGMAPFTRVRGRDQPASARSYTASVPWSMAPSEYSAA